MPSSARRPRAPVRLNPRFSPELERIINKALEKRPELRYQSAADMRVDLTRALRETQSGFSTGVAASQRDRGTTRALEGTGGSRGPRCPCRNGRGRVAHPQPHARRRHRRRHPSRCCRSST